MKTEKKRYVTPNTPMKTAAVFTPTLKRIQELRNAGQSLSKIADTLQAEGVKPMGRARVWHKVMVKRCVDQLDQLPPAATQAVEPDTPLPQPSLKIEIHGPYTAADLSLWTFLLNQIEDELIAGKEYTLPLPTAFHALEVGKGSPTRRHLWEALQRLASTRIFWDGRLGQRRNSIATPLLSGRVIDDENILVFDYTASLVKLLRNRHQRARLHLLLESKKR